jgi:ketosteroid isomerase-like protein
MNEIPSSDTPDLQARVQRLEDRAELDELIFRYAIAVDDCDLAGVVESFTEDGVFRRSGESYRGHDAIRDFFHGSMMRYTATLHVLQGSAFEFVSPERAIGLLSGRAELGVNGKVIVNSHRYRDEYARTADGWRIADRALSFMYVTEVTSYPAVWGDDLRIRWPGQQPQLADFPAKYAGYADWAGNPVG